MQKKTQLISSIITQSLLLQTYRLYLSTEDQFWKLLQNRTWKLYGRNRTYTKQYPGASIIPFAFSLFQFTKQLLQLSFH